MMVSTPSRKLSCTHLTVLVVVFFIIFNFWYMFTTSTQESELQTGLTDCTTDLAVDRSKYVKLQHDLAISEETRKQLEEQLRDELERGQRLLTQQPSTQSNTQQSQQVNGDKRKHPFSVEIKLLTYNRFASVERCLKSLRLADYDGDTVDLAIYIDHFAYVPGMSPQEHDTKLKTNQKILQLATALNWPFGKKTVHYRQTNAHLQFQWLESYYPLDNHTYAFIVEDDIAVSPYYYLYLRKMLYHYRYKEPVDRHIYGISFQKQKLVPGHGSNVRMPNVFNGNQPFLYQLIGTWGQVMFPEPWREFRKYYDERRFLDDPNVKPFLGGMITDHWYKISKEKLWTPWIIRWAYANNMYNLYANFGMRALSVSYRDGGVNYNKTMGPDSVLITPTNEPNFKNKYLGQNLIDSSKLARYDYCFKVVPRGTVHRAERLMEVKPNLPTPVMTILIPGLATDVKFMHNQLCASEQNVSRVLEAQLRRDHYFYTTDRAFAEEIAYRGFNAILNEKTTLSGFLAGLKHEKVLLINQNNQVLLSPTPQIPADVSSIRDPNKRWIYLSSEGSALSSIDQELNTFDGVYSALSDAGSIRSGTAADLKVGFNSLFSVGTSASQYYLISDDDYGCLALKCKR